ncbi:hypothetical protein RR46_03564 [Papilio xuthus]|uniref:Uncharacterized protein n=1 Tax=Papilio xuthus TaxID=66420 RepID=A0A194QD78_PAPXU|nr:hypothetical protein RR46_03564 [Papilio xuthus]
MNTRRIADKAWDLMPIDVNLLTNIFSIAVTVMEFFGLQKFFGKIKEAKSVQDIHDNKEMDLVISILMSSISSLLCLTLPFAMIESPMELFNNKLLISLRYIAEYIEKNLSLIDQIIFVLTLLLIYAGLRNVFNAINVTKLNVSPWIQKGKYLSRKQTTLASKNYKNTTRNDTSFSEKTDKINMNYRIYRNVNNKSTLKYN